MRLKLPLYDQLITKVSEDHICVYYSILLVHNIVLLDIIYIYLKYINISLISDMI